MLDNPRWHLEPWRKVLLDAADEIERRGHCKGALQDADGRVCISGAINVVTVGRARIGEDMPEANRQARAKLIDFLGLPISHYNNEPERSAGEITAKIRACASAA